MRFGRSHKFVFALLFTLGCDSPSENASNITPILNENPLVFAGYDQTVALNQTVELLAEVNGSEAQQYNWTFVNRPAASNAEFNNPNGPSTNFEADVAGVWLIRLQVSINEQQISDLVSITVQNVEVPEPDAAIDLDAGVPDVDVQPDADVPDVEPEPQPVVTVTVQEPRLIEEDRVLILRGSASTTIGDIDSLLWTIEQSPNNIGAQINDADKETASLLLPAPGEWIFRLTATSGNGTGQADQLVFVSNDYELDANCRVLIGPPLNGDCIEGDAIKIKPLIIGENDIYEWLELPQGVRPDELSDIYDQGLRFTPRGPGNYIIRTGEVDIRIFSITVMDRNDFPPRIIGGGPDSVATGTRIELTFGLVDDVSTPTSQAQYQISLVSAPSGLQLSDIIESGGPDNPPYPTLLEPSRYRFRSDVPGTYIIKFELFDVNNPSELIGSFAKAFTVVEPD